MSNENHPREETEQTRVYARKKLRTLVERRIERHGVGFPNGILSVVSAGMTFNNGLPGHMTHIRGRIGSQRYDVVKVNVYHTDDLMGPLTQYTSKSPGEFTRSDLNPSALNAPSIEGASPRTEDASEADLLIKTFGAAAEQLKNAASGIDEHPITAQEARDVLDRVQAARMH